MHALQHRQFWAGRKPQGVQAVVLLVTRILNGRLAATIFTELYVDERQGNKR